MTYQYKTLGLAAALALAPMAASAATVDPAAIPDGFVKASISPEFQGGWATAIWYDPEATRGTANDRENPENALGPITGSNSQNESFFEIGQGSEIFLTFGETFLSPGNIVEITFGGGDADWFESVDVFGGLFGDLDADYDFLASIDNIGAGDTDLGGASFEFAGKYQVLRLIDTTPELNEAGNPNPGYDGGFDVAGVQVQPVPLPAAGWLMLAGFGGLAALRRRKQAA